MATSAIAAPNEKASWGPTILQSAPRIRLAGRVVPGSIHRDPRTSTVRFQVWQPLDGTSGGFSAPVSVRYHGMVPDTFRDGAEVVLEGDLSADGIFRAETLLAKCPSRYEGKGYGETVGAHEK